MEGGRAGRLIDRVEVVAAVRYPLVLAEQSADGVDRQAVHVGVKDPVIKLLVPALMSTLHRWPVPPEASDTKPVPLDLSTKPPSPCATKWRQH